MPLRARWKGGFDWSKPRWLWVIRQMSDEVHGHCFEYILRWWWGEALLGIYASSPRLFSGRKEEEKEEESRKGFVLLLFSIKANISAVLVIVAALNPEPRFHIPEFFQMPPSALRSARYPAGASDGSVRCCCLISSAATHCPVLKASKVRCC
ncbi:hypothetical protein HDV57DRAFT_392539 [Trichoderma longibrachiatum]